MREKNVKETKQGEVIATGPSEDHKKSKLSKNI